MTKLNLTENNIYSEHQLYDYIKMQNPSATDQKCKWILFELERSGEINRIGTKRYIAGLTKYKHTLNSIAQSIDDFLTGKLPDIDYIVWESIQLNEWSNLLLNQNTIFIDVDKELIDFVVDQLIEQFGAEYTILVNPSEADIARYRRNNLIVVKKLFSRSPSVKHSHCITLEKLLIDLLCDRYYQAMVDTSATKDIYVSVKQNYAIDTTKMFNYAKRRRVLELANSMWGE